MVTQTGSPGAGCSRNSEYRLVPCLLRSFNAQRATVCPFPLPKVRATHPDCSIVLYFQEQEAECLEIIRTESQRPAPPGQQGECDLLLCAGLISLD